MSTRVTTPLQKSRFANLGPKFVANFGVFVTFSVRGPQIGGFLAKTGVMCSLTAYIFTVPLGPRFDFITSWMPLAAEILTARAWAALATSALGFNKLIAIISKCRKN
mgnify:FL=1